MLSTMLITTALGVGDIITGTVQAVAVASLGRVDEIAHDPNGQAAFPLARFDQVAAGLRTSPAIAGAMPVIVRRGQLLADVHSRQIATVDVIGVPARIPPVFGPVHGPGRTLITPATLGPDDVLVNPKLAEAMAPAPGDLLYLFHDGRRSTLHVRALVNAPGITGIKPTAIMALPAVAGLKGWPGQANAVVVANRGTASNSAGETDAAVSALQSLLPDFVVDAVKREGVETFARAQDIFTRVLVLFTLFAAGISLLLILLVYTLLVAERRAEMGVARALGTARGHLVQTFLFEGAVYDLVAAALGVGVGLAIGSVMTALTTGALTTLGVTVAGQVQPRSLTLAYGLGALCTGLTVTIASWWVSNLNIVAAMRGLPDDRRHSGMREALWRAWRALSLAGRALLHLRPVLAGRALLGDLPRAALLLAWRLVVGGLPLLLPGLWLLQAGLAAMDPALFAVGATGSIVGGMLVLRALLRLARVPPRLADRLAITPSGLALPGFCALPITQFDAWGWPRFTDGVEVFFVAGVMMVAGGVLVAVYNVDLLLSPFMAALTLAGWAATARVALAYPLHHKGRSSLALAMFALVSFTLTVMAVIIAATLHSYGDLGAAGNGFDLQATTAFGAVPDVARSVGGLPYLPRGTLAVACSTALSPVGVIQLDAARPRWSLYALNRVTDGFLSGTTLHLTTRAAGYDSDAAVWRALRTHPHLAVIDSAAVLSAQGHPAAPAPALPTAYAQAPLLALPGVHAQDRTLAPPPRLG